MVRNASEDQTVQQSPLNRIFWGWARRYRKEARRNAYLDFCDMIPDYESILCEDFDSPEGKGAVEKAEEAVDQYIFFIYTMSISRFLGAETPANLERIRRFLNYQHPEPYFFHFRKRTPNYTIRFQSTCSLFTVTVRVNRLGEFDFADSWADRCYDNLWIRHNHWRVWTEQRIRAICRSIARDFDFDGYKTDIQINSGKPGQPAKQPIDLELNVKE